ncbi:MAG: beta-glucuronidase [Prevotella sp.]|jgi:beta-glucuronidase
MRRLIIGLFIICLFPLLSKGETKNCLNVSLRPQVNACREAMNLSGLWSFCADSANVGLSMQWQRGLPQKTDIAVPGSWNEQIENMHNYMGPAWYERMVVVPSSWRDRRVVLRFGSVVYAAQVWVNGQLVGSHEGGHLAFAFAIDRWLKWGEPNRITVRVENELRPDRVPAGKLKGGAMHNFPDANYDFFPYCGLNRDVWLMSEPHDLRLNDITVQTDCHGKINIEIEKEGGDCQLDLSVIDSDCVVARKKLPFHGGVCKVTMNIANVKLWSPAHPHLYTLQVQLVNKEKPVDCYNQVFGFRTIRVCHGQLLLNDEPIRLRGFGRHEDFPVFGRGTALPVMVKDFQLMRWLGANAVRTSHYPYDEQFYDLADREGILVIDEIPAVGLTFYDADNILEARRQQCSQYIREMIARDKNHPSVIAWCVANEPALEKKGQVAFTGEEKTGAQTEHQRGKEFLTSMMDEARQLDDTRPVTFVGVMGGPSDWLGAADFIAINRYYGWYTDIGSFPKAISRLGTELDKLHALFPDKPIVMTEFGADAISGMHSRNDEMFSEEFQWKLIKTYLDMANTRSFVAGMMVWNFADFKTGQAIMRVGGMNLKGIFTRDRQPKLSADMLHGRWAGKEGF